MTRKEKKIKWAWGTWWQLKAKQVKQSNEVVDVLRSLSASLPYPSDMIGINFRRNDLEAIVNSLSSD